jgi:hypothetical protein
MRKPIGANSLNIYFSSSKEMPGIPFSFSKSSDDNQQAIETNSKLLMSYIIGIVLWTAGWYIVDDTVSIITTNKGLRILVFFGLFVICSIIVLLTGWA